jgi:hypothetical protein
MSKILFNVISIAQCAFVAPSCNSFITLYVYVVDKHRLNLLSYPILYQTPFFIAKGSTLLANRCFCLINKDSSIYQVYKKVPDIIQPFWFY